MAYLPEEIVVEIMSRLPPESLIRAKCVDKHWYFLIDTLINDPSFVSKHLRNLNPPSPTIALTCLRFLTPDHHARRYEELFSLLSLFSNADDGEGISSATEFLDLPTVPDQTDASSVAVSHCNGVICLADYFDNIVLSNPAINKSRALPKPGLAERFVSQGVGFGYDARADDYKVVRFGRHAASARHQAEVYSLRADAWREIEPDSSSSAAADENYYFPCLNVELYFEGRFYWMMMSSAPDYKVRWFDMSDELFSSVDVPESVHVARARWTSLGVWEGRVGLFLCLGSEEEVGPASVEVWVMEDSGGRVNGSWVKKLTIGPLEGIDCPLAFWKSDELLMRGSDCKEVVSYNVGTGQLRNVGVHGLDAIGCRAFSYVKSLVSV